MSLTHQRAEIKKMGLVSVGDVDGPPTVHDVLSGT